MIIFFYGNDTYRLRQKKKELVERYKKIHKNRLDLKYLDAEQEEFDVLRNEIQSVSMFAQKKLIIVQNLFLNDTFKNNFLKSLKIFVDSEDTILICEERETQKDKLAEGKFFKDKLFTSLKKNSRSQEFSLLEGTKLKNWVKREFAKYDTQIKENALERLLSFVGNDLWRMENEIRKLVSYKNRKEIKVEDIDSLIVPKIETAIFVTVDAIVSGNRKKAISLVYKHLEKGDSPLYIFSMMKFQFRNLLIIKELIEKNIPFQILPKKSNLHPYIVKKSYYQSRGFSLETLKKIYHEILRIDFNIKTGKINPETALGVLIAKISV